MDCLSSPIDDFFFRVGGMPTSTLQDRIKIGMRRLAIPTQAALARKMGVNRQTVNRWHKGDGTYPEPEMLVKLADALNVSIRWLAVDGPEMAPEQTLTVAQAEVLAIYQQLNRNPMAAEKWLSHGRDMVELITPQGAANPFGSRRR